MPNGIIFVFIISDINTQYTKQMNDKTNKIRIKLNRQNIDLKTRTILFKQLTINKIIVTVYTSSI